MPVTVGLIIIFLIVISYTAGYLACKYNWHSLDEKKSNQEFMKGVDVYKNSKELRAYGTKLLNNAQAHGNEKLINCAVYLLKAGDELADYEYQQVKKG